METAARQVTSEELEIEMTDWDTPLILDVFAIWCGPCAVLKPEFEKASGQTDRTVFFTIILLVLIIKESSRVQVQCWKVGGINEASGLCG